eukprot:8360641-Alexandrium_andersonii.AAC.1
MGTRAHNGRPNWCNDNGATCAQRTYGMPKTALGSFRGFREPVSQFGRFGDSLRHFRAKPERART